MEKSKKKRVISLISFCLSLFIFAFALTVFIVTLNARAKNRPAELFGYSFAIVLTGSMYPEIKVGEMIVVKSCDIGEIAVGENAVFIGVDGDFKDKCIVHKVVEVQSVADISGGQGVQLITKGVNNSEADFEPVTASNFIGKEVYHSAALGAILSFLQTPANWLYIIVLIIVAVVIVCSIKRIVRYAKNSKNKEEEDK